MHTSRIKATHIPRISNRQVSGCESHRSGRYGLFNTRGKVPLFHCHKVVLSFHNNNNKAKNVQPRRKWSVKLQNAKRLRIVSLRMIKSFVREKLIVRTTQLFSVHILGHGSNKSKLRLKNVKSGLNSRYAWYHSILDILHGHVLFPPIWPAIIQGLSKRFERFKFGIFYVLIVKIRYNFTHK